MFLQDVLPLVCFFVVCLAPGQVNDCLHASQWSNLNCRVNSDRTKDHNSASPCDVVHHTTELKAHSYEFYVKFLKNSSWSDISYEILLEILYKIGHLILRVKFHTKF